MPHPADVQLVDDAIKDPTDPWDLKHYRNRLADYYGADAKMIGKILDIYAHANTALSIDDTWMRLQSEGSPLSDRDQLVEFVERLALDHYLVLRRCRHICLTAGPAGVAHDEER